MLFTIVGTIGTINLMKGSIAGPQPVPAGPDIKFLSNFLRERKELTQ